MNKLNEYKEKINYDVFKDVTPLPVRHKSTFDSEKVEAIKEALELDVSIVAGGEDILYEEMPEFDFKLDNPQEIADKLNKVLNHHNAHGVAANQLGIRKRVFALKGDEKNLVVFNPKVVHTENEVIGYEGCLSYPNLWIKIKRASYVRARFKDVNGEVQTMTFDGMGARAFLHELDHLDGIDFIKRASRYHREQAMRKFKKAKRLNKKRLKNV